MRKTISILAVVIIILSLFGCTNNSPIRKGDELKDVLNKYDALYSMNGLYVFYIDDVYWVTICDNYIIEEIVAFSAEREVCYITGLKPQKISDISVFVGKNLYALPLTLGELHINIGSGFYIPSYITTDAYLVSFWANDSTITSAAKLDLFTGETLEWA